MFSGRIDVVLEYRIVPLIINDSFRRGQQRLLILGLQVGQWCSNFDTYTTKDSHIELGSIMMVSLGILDFSNGEGGSSIGEDGVEGK